MTFLEKNNLKDLVKEGIHLVDFYATWCGPCKMLASVLEDIDNEIDIIEVDVDKFKDLSQEYRIMSIPVVMFFKDGKKVKELVGFQDKDTLLEIINELK